MSDGKIDLNVCSTSYGKIDRQIDRYTVRQTDREITSKWSVYQSSDLVKTVLPQTMNGKGGGGNMGKARRSLYLFHQSCQSIGKQLNVSRGMVQSVRE